jgi:hypothetical protein
VRHGGAPFFSLFGPDQLGLFQDCRFAPRDKFFTGVRRQFLDRIRYPRHRRGADWFSGALVGLHNRVECIFFDGSKVLVTTGLIGRHTDVSQSWLGLSKITLWYFAPVAAPPASSLSTTSRALPGYLAVNFSST